MNYLTDLISIDTVEQMERDHDTSRWHLTRWISASEARHLDVIDLDPETLTGIARWERTGVLVAFRVLDSSASQSRGQNASLWSIKDVSLHDGTMQTDRKVADVNCAPALRWSPDYVVETLGR